MADHEPEQRWGKEMLASPIHQHDTVLGPELLPEGVCGSEATHAAT
jgi:hypothetical protein